MGQVDIRRVEPIQGLVQRPNGCVTSYLRAPRIAPAIVPGAATRRRRDLASLRIAPSASTVVRIDDPIHADSPGTVARVGNPARNEGTAWSSKNHPTTKKPNSMATVSARAARAKTTEAAIPARNTAGTGHVPIGVPGDRSPM